MSCTVQVRSAWSSSCEVYWFYPGRCDSVITDTKQYYNFVVYPYRSRREFKLGFRPKECWNHSNWDTTSRPDTPHPCKTVKLRKKGGISKPFFVPVTWSSKKCVSSSSLHPRSTSKVRQYNTLPCANWKKVNSLDWTANTIGPNQWKCGLTSVEFYTCSVPRYTDVDVDVECGAIVIYHNDPHVWCQISNVSWILANNPQRTPRTPRTPCAGSPLSYTHTIFRNLIVSQSGQARLDYNVELN